MTESPELLIAVGTTNTSKLAGVRQAFQILHPDVIVTIVPHPSPSGVPDLPFGDAQCLEGAANRANACRAPHGQCAYFVGIESGLRATAPGPILMSTYAWITNGTAESFGVSAAHIVAHSIDTLDPNEFSQGRQTISELTQGRYTLENRVVEATLSALAVLNTRLGNGQARP